MPMALRAAVFLITLSGLMFEIGLTRIYSATIWYHFTFVAVSVALLGWGLGGLAVHLTKHRIVPSFEKAAWLVVAYSATILLCLVAIVQFPFTIDRLPLYFVAPLVPFFLAGMALSMIFDLRRQVATSLYFADLLGASVGALSVTFLLQVIGGEASVLVAAAAPLLAAACLSRTLRVAATIGAAVVAAGALFNGRTGWFHVIPGSLKAMRRQMDQLPGARVTQTGWNAYSRIDAVEGFPAPNLARLYIDSDAWTSIHTWDGNLDSVRDMRDWYRALAFKFMTHPDTMVIGPGGGADVLAALAAGSRKVTAVELNPLMIQFVRHYGSRAGNLYDRPDVEVIQSEGRNFVSRTDRKFDVILLGFVDSWASVASGGLSLSENYLYTTQAFRAYFDHLTDDGLLTIIRWDADIPRLVANSVALLGPAEAAKRVVVLMEKRDAKPDDQPQMIFMLRKRPFTAAETEEIVSNWSIARPVLVPGRVTTSPYTYLLDGEMSLAAWDAQSPTRIGPVFDDSPFYFAIERPWGMATRIARMLFQVLVLPVLGLLALFIAFGKPRGRPISPYAASIVYFASLGFGFISVELALLQNLTLLLGHPIFTLSVLLFTLLAAGGIGSALSRRVPVFVACLVVAALGSIDAFALPTLVPALLPLSLSARVVIAVALIAPLGLAMGMPFPRGLQRAGQGSLPAPPFYWGLNGIMSVIGSVATVVVALSFGFRAAMVMGSGCYVLAALASRALESAVSEAAPSRAPLRPAEPVLANRLRES
jgi:predicted membrane-bound spermidine synthase